jgi:hypothetical protein
MAHLPTPRALIINQSSHSQMSFCLLRRNNPPRTPLRGPGPLLLVMFGRNLRSTRWWGAFSRTTRSNKDAHEIPNVESVICLHPPSTHTHTLTSRAFARHDKTHNLESERIEAPVVVLVRFWIAGSLCTSSHKPRQYLCGPMKTCSCHFGTFALGCIADTHRACTVCIQSGSRGAMRVDVCWCVECCIGASLCV